MYASAVPFLVSAWSHRPALTIGCASYKRNEGRKSHLGLVVVETNYLLCMVGVFSVRTYFRFLVDLVHENVLLLHFDRSHCLLR